MILQASKAKETPFGFRRDEWLETFLKEELSLRLWSYLDDEGFPIWAFIRNTIASLLSSKQNLFDGQIHAKTRTIDHSVKYPIEHLRVIKDIFLRENPKHDALFIVPIDALRRDIENNKLHDILYGGYYPLFEKPLIFEAPYKGEFYRLFDGVSPENVYFYSSILILSKFAELLYPFSVNKKQKELYRELAGKTESISKGLIKKADAEKMLDSMEKKKWFYKLFVKKLVTKVQGKKAFIHCGCYLEMNAFISWSLHHEGFVIIESQHGYVGGNHYAYNYPKEIFDMPGVREIFPDYFLTFGDKWGGGLSIPSQIIPIGNKYLEDFEKESNISPKPTDNTILVVSPSGAAESMISILKALSCGFPDKRIIFKLHPGEVPFKERYLELDSLPNVDIVGFENIYPLICKAGIIVSSNGSTTLFESLAFPGKSIFCIPHSYTDTEKEFTFFNNPEELVQMILDGKGKMSSGAAEKYWKKNWDENVKKLPFMAGTD